MNQQQEEQFRRFQAVELHQSQPGITWAALGREYGRCGPWAKRTISRWEETKLVFNRKKSGRPPLFSPEVQCRVVELLQQRETDTAARVVGV